MFSPPAASAGKNFTTSRPNSIACSTSLGLDVPGVTGMPLSIQYYTTLGFNPGLTMNFAPAFTARSTCSVVSTVPAPTSISGYLSVIILMDSSAAAVRKVTSAQGSPPSHSAFARGSASLRHPEQLRVQYRFSEFSAIPRSSYIPPQKYNSIVPYYETQFHDTILTIKIILIFLCLSCILLYLMGYRLYKLNNPILLSTER